MPDIDQRRDMEPQRVHVATPADCPPELAARILAPLDDGDGAAG